MDSCSLLWQTLCLYSQWDAKDMLVCCCCAPCSLLVNHCKSFWLIDLFLVWSVSPAWIHHFSTSILKLFWNDNLFMTNKENIVDLFLRSFHKKKKKSTSVVKDFHFHQQHFLLFSDHTSPRARWARAKVTASRCTGSVSRLHQLNYPLWKLENLAFQLD